MDEKQLKEKVLHLLSIGTLQQFQVEDYLRLSAVPEYRITELTKDIKEVHHRSHPCI